MRLPAPHTGRLTLICLLIRFLCLTTTTTGESTCWSALGYPSAGVLPAPSGDPLDLEVVRLSSGPHLSLLSLNSDGTIQEYDSTFLVEGVDMAEATSLPVPGPTTLVSGISFPFEMAAADWDSDGLIDLLVATQVDLVWVRNQGTPSSPDFSSPSPPVSLVSLGGFSPVTPTYFAAADVGGDGAPELLLLSSSSVSPLVVCTKSLVTDDACTLSSPPPPPPSPSFVNPSIAALADFDGDGNIDVAGAGVYDSSGISLWLSVGSASPPAAILFTSPSNDDYAYLAAGDLDGDGIPDIVAVTSAAPATSNRVPYVLISDPASVRGGTPSPVALPDGAEAPVAVVDTDRDGANDLIFLEDLNVAFRGSQPVVSTTIGAVPASVGTKLVVSPLNSDGSGPAHVFAIASPSPPGIMHLSPTFPSYDDTARTLATFEGATSTHMTLGDVSNDGVDDVVVTRYGIQLVFGSPPQFIGRVEIINNPVPGSSGVVHTLLDSSAADPVGPAILGDADSDGDLDIVVSLGDSLLLILNTNPYVLSSSGWASPTLLVAGPGTGSAATSLSFVPTLPPQVLAATPTHVLSSGGSPAFLSLPFSAGTSAFLVSPVHAHPPALVAISVTSGLNFFADLSGPVLGSPVLIDGAITSGLLARGLITDDDVVDFVHADGTTVSVYVGSLSPGLSHTLAATLDTGVSENGYGIVVGDSDGDGIDDTVVVTTSSSFVVVAVRLVGPSSTVALLKEGPPPPVSVTHGGAVAVGDTNGDGVVDVIVSDATGSIVEVKFVRGLLHSPLARGLGSVVGPRVPLLPACLSNPWSLLCVQSRVARAPACVPGPGGRLALASGNYSACPVTGPLALAKTIRVEPAVSGEHVGFVCSEDSGGVAWSVTSPALESADDSSAVVVTFSNVSFAGARLETVSRGSHLVLDGVSIESGSGTCVSVRGGSVATVRHSSVSSCGSTLLTSGGGVAVTGAGSAARLESVTLSGNTALSGGGLAVGSGASVVVIDSWIESNTAVDGVGGGAVFRPGANGTLVDVRVSGNVASSLGGGLALVSALDEALLKSQTAISMRPAVTASSSGHVSLSGSGSVIASNSAGRYGGGMMICGGGGLVVDGDALAGMEAGGWTSNTAGGGASWGPGMTCSTEFVTPDLSMGVLPVTLALKGSEERLALIPGVSTTIEVVARDGAGNLVVDQLGPIKLVGKDVPSRVVVEGTQGLGDVLGVVDGSPVASPVVGVVGETGELSSVGVMVLVDEATGWEVSATLTGCPSSSGVAETAPGMLGCVGCQEGTFQSEDGAWAPCSVPEVCGTGSARIGSGAELAPCVCLPGYFIESNVTDAGSGGCFACPTGAECAGGEAEPSAQVGWYRGGDGRTFYRCVRPRACVGQSQCAVGYTGELCLACLPDYYSRGRDCEPCSGSPIPLVLVALVGVVALVTAGVAGCVAGHRLGTRTAKVSTRPVPPPTIAMGVGALQVASLIGSAPLSWGRSSSDVFSALAVVNLDLDMLRLECLRSGSASAETAFYTKFVGTLALMMVLYGVAVVSAWGKARSSGVTLTLSAVSVLCMMGPLMYLPIARLAFGVFDCIEVGDGEWVLDREPAAACFTRAWLGFALGAGVLVVVFVLGFPVVAGIFLGRTSPARLFEPGMVSRLGSLYALYRPSQVQGVVVELLHRLCVVTAATFASEAPVVLALLLVGSLGGSVLFSIKKRPLFFPLHNTGQALLHTLTLVLVFLGVVSYAERDSGDDGSGTRVFVDVLTVGVLVVLVCSIVILTVMDVRQIVGERQRVYSAPLVRKKLLDAMVDVEMADIEARGFTVRDREEGSYTYATCLSEGSTTTGGGEDSREGEEEEGYDMGSEQSTSS